MEITIISLIEDVGCINLRYLSSYIRSKGHTTKLIFLPRLYSEGWGSDESYKYPYPTHIINQIKELCLSSDVIAISLMSCHFDNAVHITKCLNTLAKPIIWGGIHPTISPYECLNYADLVCIGEGEKSIVKFLNILEDTNYNSWCTKYSCHCSYLVGTSSSSCMVCEQKSNIAGTGLINSKDQPITVGERIENLNDLPFPDYDFKHQYVLYKNNITPLNKNILSECFNGRYRSSFSRGCTSSCTYCCNNVLKNLYGNHPIRWRSIDNQIAELKWTKENLDNITTIEFSDDTFLSRSTEEIKYFASRYKEEINLPFTLLSTPLAVNYDKIKALTWAGLINIGIGVQTVYEPTRNLYKRHETIDQTIKAAKIISQVSKDNAGLGSKSQIIIRYDFIVDNPWGNSIETEANIRFALTLPKPRQIRIFSLVFYHGTELYNMAKKEKLIKDELNEVLRVTQLTPKPTYMNNVFTLLSKGCPDIIIKFLLNKHIRSTKLVKILNYLWSKQKKYISTKHNAKEFNGLPGEII